MKKIVLALSLSILNLNAMDPHQEEPILSQSERKKTFTRKHQAQPTTAAEAQQEDQQSSEQPEAVPQPSKPKAKPAGNSYTYNANNVEINSGIAPIQIQSATISRQEKPYEQDSKLLEKLAATLAHGGWQALEAAPQVATQVAVQAVASELTQLGIEKVKELFDADLRETKEFVAIMSKLKQTTEKFQILIDSMNSAHKQNLELLKRNPEDATIKEMVQKTEAEMLVKKKKLLQRHNQLVALYTNKLVDLACQDTEKKEQPIITPQRVALGGVATAAIVAGFTYLRK